MIIDFEYVSCFRRIVSFTREDFVVNNYVTVSDLARHFDRRPNQIAYVLRREGIQPQAWIGHTRVFDASVVPDVEDALRRLRPWRRRAHALSNNAQP